MNKHSFLSFRSIIVFFFIIILLPNNIFPLWSSNTTESAFFNDGKLKSTLPMDYYIINGADAFLNSYNLTLSYMRKTETMALTGVDAVELKSILDNALIAMKTANGYYTQLKTEADNTSYNSKIIASLKTFDYEGFIKSNDTILNKEVFLVVKSFLINGDVRGIYGKMCSNTEEIINVLNRIIEATASGTIPVLADTWKVNQLFSNALLFGQYTTQVFNVILNEAK